MTHIHTITDTDRVFKIDIKTRQITPTGATRLKLIQGDHNSESLTFEVPRFIEGHDVTACTKVEIHYNNISADKKNQSRNVYLVDDLRAVSIDDTVTFSWLISGAATKHEGILAFLIRFTCLNGTEVEYAWHTDVYRDVLVGEGINNGEAVLAYTDILEAWKADLLTSFEQQLTELVEQTTAHFFKQVEELQQANAALEERVEILEGGVLKYDEVYSESKEVLVPATSAKKAFIQSTTGYKRSSSNLLDPALFGWEVNEKGEIYHPGDYASASCIIKLKPGTYTIDVSGYAVYVVNKRTSETYGPVINSPITFTINENSDILVSLVSDYSDTSAEAGWFTVMLNEGESAQPFENYYIYSPVSVTAVESRTRNLLDNKKALKVENWIPIEGTANHCYPLEFENEGIYIFNGAGDATGMYLYIQRKLPGGAFSSSGSVIKNGQPYAGYFFANGVIDTPMYIEHKKGYEWRLWMSNISQDKLNQIDCIQIEKGELNQKASPYTEYGTISTCEIPDAIYNLDGYGECICNEYYNKVDFDNKKFIKKVFTYSFTGEESFPWNESGDDGNGIKRIYIKSTDNIFPAFVEDVGKCNLYEIAPWATRTSNPLNTWCVGGAVLFRIPVTMTFAEWKAKLKALNAAGTPLTFTAALVTPVETDISNLLEEFDNSIEVAPCGIIRFVSEDDNAVTEADYVKSELAFVLYKE